MDHPTFDHDRLACIVIRVPLNRVVALLKYSTGELVAHTDTRFRSKRDATAVDVHTRKFVDVEVCYQITLRGNWRSGDCAIGVNTEIRSC